jgi:site-specific recombinase XerD
MTILTNSQINQYCLDLLNVSQGFDFFIHDLFLNLYYTGCRYQELYQINRWSTDLAGNYTLQPLKGNNLRTFINTPLTPLFTNCIDNQVLPYQTARYTTARRYLSRLSTIPFLMIKNKEVSTHIFRHNRAKQMHEDEISDADIQLWFGENTLSAMQNYIYSEVYYN